MTRIMLALFALAVTVGCMSGDDDDDDGYQCDFGQWYIHKFGKLASPVQECIHNGGEYMECLCAEQDHEIEWTCHCAPEKCSRIKVFYDTGTGGKCEG